MYRGRITKQGSRLDASHIAKDDDTAYPDYRDRYRAVATSLGFEGYIEWAEAMP